MRGVGAHDLDTKLPRKIYVKVVVILKSSTFLLHRKEMVFSSVRFRDFVKMIVILGLQFEVRKVQCPVIQPRLYQKVRTCYVVVHFLLL